MHTDKTTHVEGEFVATMFDMETVNGIDKVVDFLHISGGQRKAIHSLIIRKRRVEQRSRVKIHRPKIPMSPTRIR